MTGGLLSRLRELLLRMSLALPDPRPRRRMVELGLGLLCGDAPKTVTSAIGWKGVGGDWSGDYRLFSKTAWRPEDVFMPVLAEAVARCGGTVFAAIDDTLVRKTGRKIPGTAYARDPLSPPFRANLVLGQRFLQMAVMAGPEGDRPCRAVPVSFRHAPPLKAPPRATAEEKRAVKEARKKHNMSVIGRDELSRLRADIDRLPGGAGRQLIMSADGSFANRCFLGKLPERTTVVVRIRRDARLRAVLPAERRTGNRKYGDPLPTPEQLLSDTSVPPVTVSASVGGREHALQCKILTGVCWPKTTGDRPGTLIVIKPLAYRPRKGAHLLYRQPGYLFVTGARADISQAVAAYLLRWEIEVSFRDEKTILGAGKAQVRNARSVERAPAFLVASYAALLISSITQLDDRRDALFDPLPPWRRVKPVRPSARDLVRLLRREVEAERKINGNSPAAAA